MCITSCFPHFPSSISTKYVAFLHNVIFRQEKFFFPSAECSLPTIEAGSSNALKLSTKELHLLGSWKGIALHCRKLGMERDDVFWYLVLLFWKNNSFKFFFVVVILLLLMTFGFCFLFSVLVIELRASLC